jgi:hypothetical protein
MTIKTDGLDDLNEMLAKLGAKAEEVAKKSLYQGAAIVADAFTSATKSIRTEPFKGKKDKRLPSPEEKAALIGRTGIAKFKATGSEVDTLIGITEAGGYAYVGNTKKAVRLIARSINSGTSFMNKQPVFRKAKNASQKSAVAAIIKTANEMYDEIINGSG